MNGKFTLTIVLLFSLLFSFGMAGCSDSDPVYVFPEAPKPPVEPEPGEGEKFTTEQLEGYPEGMVVYSFRDSLNSTQEVNGYYAIIDFDKNPDLRFNAAYFDTPTVPTEMQSQYSSEGRGTPLLTVNAGYFWDGASLSLLVTGGVMESQEANYVWRAHDVENEEGETETVTYTVMPIRSAFGMLEDGTFEARWIYSMPEDDYWPYTLPSAANGNDERTGTYTDVMPSVDDEGAEKWEVVEAAGAGPMLVRNGANVAVESYYNEVFSMGGIDGENRQPRTAIGVLEDNSIILFVCNGRGSNASVGYTLSEVADLFIELGVVNAINLDGGGSSAIVGKEGKVLNVPSGTGATEKDAEVEPVERAVMTAVIITEQ